MEWTEDHDHSLCQEILALEPFKAKKGSIARGQIWDQIANNLNSLEIPRFKVTKRSVRERYTLLVEKLKKKLKEEEKASGIETDMNDVEKALEEILEKEADAENTLATDKKRVDNAKAVEMRNRAMESMRTTQKRNQDDEDKDVENATKPKKKQEGVVGKQWHTYVRRMIWFRNGKLKNWNCTSSALKLRVESKTSFKSNNRQ